MVSSQITSYCQTWIESDNIFKDALITDIYNHADTHYFEKNFIPLSWSDLKCSVSPFLSEYTIMDNVQICTAATAWKNHTGQVYILVFGKVLWFGEKWPDQLSTLTNTVPMASCFATIPQTPIGHLDFRKKHLIFPY